jgi:hypothetical protein
MHKHLCVAVALAAGWQDAFAAPAESPPLVPEIVMVVADPDGFDAKAVAADKLAAVRGGADTVTNTMRLDGAVSGNSAVNVLSGANSIGNGAFSNASGLPIAIQNSGANVLIQNATIINIQMQ